jgi:putative transposase
MCRVLRVSRSGYHAWLGRPASSRARADERLGAEIRRIYQDSRATYGSPRVHAELRASGVRVGRKRVERLMRAQGLTARPPRRKYRAAIVEQAVAAVADNVLERKFDTERPDQVWVTDITYIRTWQGWLFLAVVIDLFSRKVVGWSMADHMRTELVLDAFESAAGRRLATTGLLHHSDRGSQYTSWSYQRALKDAEVRCSMSRRGNCFDNAVVESFFGSLKTELVHRHSWPTRDGARLAIHDYIGTFYNPKRRHTANGLVSPDEFEERYHHERQMAA